MEPAELKNAAAAAARKLKAAREALGRSPALALLAAVAVGFAGGMLLRWFEKPRSTGKAPGSQG